MTGSIWRDGGLLAAWCAIIFFLSSQSALPVPTELLFPHSDKLMHATAYAVMGMLAWQAFRHAGLKMAATLLLSAGFCSLYGVSDEWHQSFVPGRMVDPFDWLADTVGGIAGAIVAARILRR